MTEAEWASSDGPEPMLRCLLGVPSMRERLRAWLPWPANRAVQQRPQRPSERKLRLYACACCRAIWELLRNEKSREAVETSERFADGEADVATLNAAGAEAWLVADGLVPTAVHEYVTVAGGGGFMVGKVWPWAARAAAETTTLDAAAAALATDAAVERAGLEWVPEGADVRRVAALIGAKVRAGWLRDIVGNPFSTPHFDPAWRTQNVLALAQSVYDERAFDRLAILADALEDAGCDNADLLAHLRSPGSHLRGCWPVDLLLAKM